MDCPGLHDVWNRARGERALGADDDRLSWGPCPPHSHTSAEHMVLVSGELDVHYKGRPAVSMQTGDYAYGPPGLPHLGHCRSKAPCTLFIAFELPVDATAYPATIP